MHHVATLSSFLAALRKSSPGTVIIPLQKMSWSPQAKAGLWELHRPGQLEALKKIGQAARSFLELPEQDTLRLNDALIYCFESFTTYVFFGRFAVLTFTYFHDEGLLRILSIESYAIRSRSDRALSALSPSGDQKVVALPSRRPVTSNYDRILTRFLSDDDRAFLAKVAKPGGVLLARDRATQVRLASILIRRISMPERRPVREARRLAARLDMHAGNGFARAIRSALEPDAPVRSHIVVYAAMCGCGGRTIIVGAGMSLKLVNQPHTLIVAPLARGRRSEHALRAVAMALLAAEAPRLDGSEDVLVVAPGAMTTVLLGAGRTQGRALHQLREIGGVSVGAMPRPLAAEICELLHAQHFCGIRFSAESVLAIAEQFDALSRPRASTTSPSKMAHIVEWLPLLEFNLPRLCITIDLAACKANPVARTDRGKSDPETEG
jgi:hypothetical protein